VIYALSKGHSGQSRIIAFYRCLSSWHSRFPQETEAPAFAASPAILHPQSSIRAFFATQFKLIVVSSAISPSCHNPWKEIRCPLFDLRAPASGLKHPHQAGKPNRLGLGVEREPLAARTPV